MKQKVKRKAGILLTGILCMVMVAAGALYAQASGGNTVKSVSITIGKKNVTKKTYYMKVGKSKTCKAVVRPAGREDRVFYQSDRESVASVNSKGKITAKSAGTARITVTVTRGKRKKSTWMKIKVTGNDLDSNGSDQEDLTPSSQPETPQELPSGPEDSGNWEAPAESVQILLEQNGSIATSGEVEISGNTVAIHQGGSYLISGTLEDGQIYVDVGSDENVFLIFSGVDISNTKEAAVYVENAGHTAIILEEGTDNRIQSGRAARSGSNDNSESAGGAALYARDDLSISGAGSIQVYGYINNGIHTTNHLLIESGKISVEAQNHGLKGKDSVRITGGNITVRSGGDGIKSDDTSGEGYGIVSITGGTFSINSSGDAVQAETLLEISGGNFEIQSGGGSDGTAFPENSWDSPDTDWDMSDESETSMKGFKCGTEMLISGGEFSVSSRDDAFHSNGSIRILNGSIQISAGDDAIHADLELIVKDGSIQVTRCYEGLEANQILIQGGDISIAASDDGINAYGGQNRRGWGGSEKTTEEMPELRITGGNVFINADGDGLDSNGNIFIEGGIVAVDGPSDSWNGAIDSGTENGGVCEVSGGTVIAVGSSGMAETFGESSKQCSFRHNFDESFGPGDEITIEDKQRNILFRHTALKKGNSVVFSCPELEEGETYVLRAGSQRIDITMDSVSVVSGRRGGWGW